MSKKIRANLITLYAPSSDTVQTQLRELLRPGVDIGAVVAKSNAAGMPTAGDPVYVLTRRGQTATLAYHSGILQTLETEDGQRLLNGDTDPDPSGNQTADDGGSFDAIVATAYKQRRESAAASQADGQQGSANGDHPTTAAQLDPDAVYRRRQQAQGNEPT